MGGLVSVKNPSAVAGVFGGKVPPGKLSTKVDILQLKVKYDITDRDSVARYFKKNPVTFWHNYYRMIAQGYWPIFAFIGAIFTYFFRTRLVIEFVAALLLSDHGKNSSPSGGGTGGPGGAAGGDSHLLHTRPSGTSTASILQAATAGGEQRSNDDPSPTPLPQIVPAVALVVANPHPEFPPVGDSSSTTSDAGEDASDVVQDGLVDDASSSDSPPPAAAVTGAGIAQVKALSELIGAAIDEINRLADEQDVELCEIGYFECLIRAKEDLYMLLGARAISASSLHPSLAYYLLLFTTDGFESCIFTGTCTKGGADAQRHRVQITGLTPTITANIACAARELILRACGDEAFSYGPIRSGQPVCTPSALYSIFARTMQHGDYFRFDENRPCKLIFDGKVVQFDVQLEFRKMLRMGDAEASCTAWFRDSFLVFDFFSSAKLMGIFDTKDIFDRTGAITEYGADGEELIFVTDDKGSKIRVLNVTTTQPTETGKPDCSVAFRPNGIVYETFIAALEFESGNTQEFDSDDLISMCKKLRDAFFARPSSSSDDDDFSSDASDDGDGAVASRDKSHETKTSTNEFTLRVDLDLCPYAAEMLTAIANNPRTPDGGKEELLRLAADIRNGGYSNPKPNAAAASGTAPVYSSEDDSESSSSSSLAEPKPQTIAPIKSPSDSESYYSDCGDCG
ncbi:MAG: hypothetical protein LBB38_01450 [Puniceicoccales bacterium]|jgi:hypothetical protein|nr:hypothetical protein [Puniceicoccales bacterium]